ncbi:hypothetical protein ANN_20169 [Periplaneta americana]|uniref:Uncharacterized protein n=1 Tax=Periplaneta americana TaxID=6978 RepID=A0ABQ8SCJ5_PERAM|nr:hypothetical protein ANN_20169 [Periplaneta americana]
MELIFFIVFIVYLRFYRYSNMHTSITMHASILSDIASLLLLSFIVAPTFISGNFVPVSVPVPDFTSRFNFTFPKCDIFGLKQGLSQVAFVTFSYSTSKNAANFECKCVKMRQPHWTSETKMIMVKMKSQNTPILYMFMVCAMEFPCVPSLNMNDAFRTEGYHIEEYLLSMGLGERLGTAKEGENERSANRQYFGCGIKTATCNSPERPARFTPERNSALKQEEVPLKTRENIDPDF